MKVTELEEGHWPGTSCRGLPYGWAGEWSNSNTIGFDAHFEKYNNIVDWIKKNIKRPYSNAHWVKFGDCIYVHIRKRKDWIWFVMRWS